jgi:hypothetical protein
MLVASTLRREPAFRALHGSRHDGRVPRSSPPAGPAASPAPRAAVGESNRPAFARRRVRSDRRLGTDHQTRSDAPRSVAAQIGPSPQFANLATRRAVRSAFVAETATATAARARGSTAVSHGVGAGLQPSTTGQRAVEADAVRSGVSVEDESAYELRERALALVAVASSLNDAPSGDPAHVRSLKTNVSRR